jgi:hypothetical protein
MERDVISREEITLCFCIRAVIPATSNTKTVAKTHSPKVFNTWALGTKDENN